MPNTTPVVSRRFAELLSNYEKAKAELTRCSNLVQTLINELPDDHKDVGNDVLMVAWRSIHGTFADAENALHGYIEELEGVPLDATLNNKEYR